MYVILLYVRFVYLPVLDRWKTHTHTHTHNNTQRMHMHTAYAMHTHTHNAHTHARTQVVLIDTYPGLPQEERKLAATDVAFPPPAYRPASCGARCQCVASDFMKKWHTRQHRPGQHPGVLCPHDTYCLYSTGMAGDSLAGDTLTGESHAFNGSVGLDEGGREGQ